MNSAKPRKRIFPVVGEGSLERLNVNQNYSYLKFIGE